MAFSRVSAGVYTIGVGDRGKQQADTVSEGLRAEAVPLSHRAAMTNDLKIGAERRRSPIASSRRRDWWKPGLRLALAAACSLFVGVAPAIAQDGQASASQRSDDGGWRTTIYPVYGWLPIFGADVRLPEVPNPPPCDGCGSGGPIVPGGSVSSTLNGAAFAGVLAENRWVQAEANFLWAGLSAEKGTAQPEREGRHGGWRRAPRGQTGARLVRHRRCSSPRSQSQSHRPRLRRSAMEARDLGGTGRSVGTRRGCPNVGACSYARIMAAWGPTTIQRTRRTPVWNGTLCPTSP